MGWRRLVGAGAATVAAGIVGVAVARETTTGQSPPVVVDERRGALRGIRFGASEEQVRERLGVPSDDGGGFFPAGRRYTGPPGIPSPEEDQERRRRPAALHYGDTAFLVSPSIGVFSMATLDDRARTRAGIGVGDALSGVRERYHDVSCGKGVAGESLFGGTRTYPWCRAIVRGTHVFFGGDPIDSVTITRYP